MLSFVTSWFIGGGYKTLVDIYTRYKDSEDTKEKQQAEWAKAQLDAMTENRKLTAGFWEMRLMTFLIAMPFVIHVNLVGLDTNFKFGWKVHAFPAPFNEWEGTILLSFFGLTAGAIGLRAVASIFKR